jgi:D-alanyl-D-alanine carboxypeptidase
MRFISVVLFCDTKNLRSQSSRQILDYSFIHYNRISLLERGTIVAASLWRGGENAASINAAVADDLQTLIHEDEKDMLFTRVSMPEKLMAPVKRGLSLALSRCSRRMKSSLKPQ